VSFGSADSVPPSDIETVGSDYCCGATVVVDFPDHAEWIIGSLDADSVAAAEFADDFIGEVMLVFVGENDAEESGLPFRALFDAECDGAFAPFISLFLLRKPINVLFGGWNVDDGAVNEHVWPPVSCAACGS